MGKSIKLVAFDMDGTVLDSKLRLPKGLFEMIESVGATSRALSGSSLMKPSSAVTMA